MAIEHGPPWIKGAVWIFSLGIPLVIGGVGAYVSAVRDHFAVMDAEQSRRVDVLEGLVSGHSVSLASALEHADAHELDAAREIARIDRCERRLEELATDATARPDPWTGTEGRASRKIITEVERRVDVLERIPARLQWIEDRIEELAAECAASRRYYQDTVIPMIQQSNQLQMQRIQQGME